MEQMTAMPPDAIGSTIARVTAMLYATSTPARDAAGVTSRTCVAPAAMMTAGSTLGACTGICWSSVFEKTFWATEMDIAPPRVLKKIASASILRVSMLPARRKGGRKLTSSGHILRTTDALYSNEWKLDCRSRTYPSEQLVSYPDPRVA